MSIHISRVCSTCYLIKEIFNQNVLHGDTFYNIKRGKYKMVCEELLFATKTSLTELSYYSLLCL